MKEVLSKAEELEKKYDWVEAAEFYEQALRAVRKRDLSKSGEIQERISYCLYRGAFQSETQKEFKSRMLEAVRAYEKAAEAYEEVEHARGLYCNAMAFYTNSWTLIDAFRKKEILDDCERLLKEAMKAFEESRDRLGYGKACNDLLFCLLDRRDLEWDHTENKRRLEEAVEHGQKVLSTLSEVGDKREVARAYVIVGFHYVLATIQQQEEEKRKEFIQTALTYAEKALRLSKKTGDASLIAWSNFLAAFTQFSLTGNLELSLRYTEESLHEAKKTKDRFLIGYAQEDMTGIICSTMATEEDPDKRREGYERVIRYAEDAVRHYLIVCRYDALPSVCKEYIESCNSLACEVETDPEEKRSLLERAIEVGQEGLEYAKQSGVPSIIVVHHGLSKALYNLARMEIQITEKRRLLEEALKYRKESINISERTKSLFFYWNRGVFQNYAALIKAELAIIEMDSEKKKLLLEEAVLHMEKCIELCTKWTRSFPQAMLFTVLGWYYGWYGGILNQLYSLTSEEETLEKAIKVYRGAAETYQKAELPSRVAETYWHTARLYDQLREHTKSEHNFQSASENYKLAAEKIPQLKEFYMDHVLYMQAWSEIEKAKHHHAENHYGRAKEHYEKTADLHKSTEKWNYLSTNYLAWARLEEAEDLSRREQTEQARDFFQQAANLFVDAQKSIQTKSEKIESKDEKEILANLAKASNIRREYCLGRIALEEAKILDRQGNHAASSKKYGSAIEKFQHVAGAMEDEADRQEIKPIVCLCQAWQMITRAEAEASPDLYKEASKLFEEAKEHIFDEKAKVLALGHSSFCKALEAGTRFEATGDITMYSEAKKHLEASAKYYLKVGFKTASEYARGTNRLFDAYTYMNKAEIESNPKKKAEYYRMAEKLLQASAGSYMKAKHPEKSEQVQRLLESVKEERQLVMSLTEVLHVPLATSTTATFTTPTPGEETPTGLERFEHADVQANLILRVREVKVGEDINLEIELVNAGKAPALLIKVEEVVPRDFEVKRAPEIYRVEDSYLNMKGRRLAPLKTEEIRLVLRPATKGTFILKPRIMYLDETGKYKAHEPEPVTITVKELGIKGWIKGEK